MTVVKGIRISSGEFIPEGKKEAIEYNNAILNVESNEYEEVHGVTCAQIKCKIDKVRKIGFENWYELLGHEIMIGYSIASSSPQISSITKVSKNPVECTPTFLAGVPQF